MFQRVSGTDTKLIISALFILLVIVSLGVGVVEHQLATMTQRSAQERLNYISRYDNQGYWADILGYGRTIRNIIPDSVLQTGGTVCATIENYSRKHLIKPEFDKHAAKDWFTIWHKQFVGEALLTKKNASKYWSQFKPYIENTVYNIKIETQQAIHWLEEHIQEYR